MNLTCGQATYPIESGYRRLRRRHEPATGFMLRLCLMLDRTSSDEALRAGILPVGQNDNFLVKKARKSQRGSVRVRLVRRAQASWLDDESVATAFSGTCFV